MALEMRLDTIPEIPLEAELICPDKLSGKPAAEVAKLSVQYGSRQASIGDFFSVQGVCDDEIHLQGELSRVKFIGAGMTRGRIVVDGCVGMHLGAGMSGGDIRVAGDAGDWIGAEMSAGRIIVQGNAGHMVGSAVRGSHVGILGGEIIVHGSAGNEAGSAMRRGLIAIGGDSGDFTGVNMLAGTVVVLGRLGMRSGAGMRRGSIVSMHDAELLPTFAYACAYRPAYLRLYLLHLKALGMTVDDVQLEGSYRRWSGDNIELNRGEILLLDS